MGQHRLPALASRLRVNRGFDSAWYSDTHYAELLQKDWQLARNAWSLITRASRSKPRQQLTLAQQLHQLKILREARESGQTIDASAAAAAVSAKSSQAQGLAGCDYPNHRVSRIFIQQLPYKSVVSTFAYAVPKTGAQAKYGLFPKNAATSGPSPSTTSSEKAVSGETSAGGRAGR